VKAAAPLLGLLMALAALATLELSGCSHPAPAPAARENQVDALQVTDLLTGQGAEATDGANVTVNYTGWLYDRTYPGMKGKEFDSSRKPGGQPFTFVLGQRQVIEGWDEGVRGMKVGGQRRLVIPAALAYGDRGAGGVIPPGATLVFEVELLAVK
jgi:FKBP-type peptidyl-prolyl cis-trans isomerase FkpA